VANAKFNFMTIPVILDTDIGLDVDDVWALVFALKCRELDIRLITTTTGDTAYRARLVAKLLEIAKRTDIPIGMGLALDHAAETHSAWLGDYALADYSGTIYSDGVGAICQVVLDTAEPVTVIGIGPLPNIAAALQREPTIASRARFVGMHGSLRRGYLDAPKPMREYNVKQHALACKAVFEAPWEKTITPLDTCGNIMLGGARFSQIRASGDALTRAVIENHFLWGEAVRDWPLLSRIDLTQQSSILYDLVAIYLAFSEALLEIETLPIWVTSDGKTLIDDRGSAVRCATHWHNQSQFLDLVTERLCG
jgi:inosine-uridine nucleoside N-ribohydrolase